MQTATPRPLPAWLAPVLVSLIAVPTFVAFWIGGRPGLGAIWAGASVAFGVVLALGGRSDTIRILGGVDDDERTRMLDYKAMTAMSTVLIAALAALFLAAGIRGESGLVYGLLLLLAEGTRLVALAILGRRS